MIYEKTRRYIIPFEDVPSPRAEMPEISVEERRGNFTEVETGFPEDVAMADAKRCLSCRRCLGCALCWAECKPEAIDFSIPNEELDLEFDEVILTRGQDNGFQPLKKDMGFGEYPHVITDLQFERMLSPTGPTNGLVVSPLDGEIPSRIAVVQGHPDGADDHLLSSVVLGVNESIIALDRTEGLEMTVVSPLSEEFKERFMEETKAVSGLNLIEGAPISVAGGDEEGLLSLNYSENGKEKQDAFDMIVLLTKPQVSSEIQSLSRKLEQDII
jgi:heterodisulfide reductase subunit A-like polyferredoxin